MKTNIKADFKDFKVTSNGETEIKLVIKGKLTDEQILSLHKLKSSGEVFATLHSGQIDTDDIHDSKRSEGIIYDVEKDGTVSVGGTRQMTIEEAAAKVAEDVEGKFQPENEPYITGDDEPSDGQYHEENDDEPSDDEKEFESREKEVYQEERAAEEAAAAAEDEDEDLPF